MNDHYKLRHNYYRVCSTFREPEGRIVNTCIRIGSKSLSITNIFASELLKANKISEEEFNEAKEKFNKRFGKYMKMK